MTPDKAQTMGKRINKTGSGANWLGESAENTVKADDIAAYDTDRVTLQDYLKYLRESHGYSQKEVAAKLNTVRQTYSHYECGRIVPPVTALFALATFYDIPAEILIRIAEADYKRGLGDYSLEPLDDPDAWMDDIRVDLEVRPRDIKEYNFFIETNHKRYEKLRRDERCCLFYYNCLDNAEKASTVTDMKVVKSIRDTAKKWSEDAMKRQDAGNPKSINTDTAPPDSNSEQNISKE